MTINTKDEIRRGNSIIVDYKEVKLEKFDTELIAFEIAKILKEHLPMIESTKVFQNLDYTNRFKIDLLFNKPALSKATNQTIEGININISNLKKATDTERGDTWKEITPKE